MLSGAGADPPESTVLVIFKAAQKKRPALGRSFF